MNLVELVHILNWVTACLIRNFLEYIIWFIWEVQILMQKLQERIVKLQNWANQMLKRDHGLSWMDAQRTIEDEDSNDYHEEDTLYDYRLDMKGYCNPSDAVVAQLSQHGPFIEACAGNGQLSFRLRCLGMNAMAFDRKEFIGPYGHVRLAKNGTFEQAYPDRTLLIVLGQSTLESVNAYAGSKIIIGGYRFMQSYWDADGQRRYRNNFGGLFRQDHKDEYTLRPSPEWMCEHGWTYTETITGPDTDREYIDLVFMVYLRTAPNSNHRSLVPGPRKDQQSGVGVRMEGVGAVCEN